jgi:dCMP deaminase
MCPDYVTHLPCINCIKTLINAGISRIVCSVAYCSDEHGMNFLKPVEIEVTQFEPRP